MNVIIIKKKHQIKKFLFFKFKNNSLSVNFLLSFSFLCLLFCYHINQQYIAPNPDNHENKES